MATATLGTDISPFRRWLARSRAWISLLIMAPVAFAVLFSRPRMGSLGLDVSSEIVGGALFAAGAFVRWWATLYIGGQKTTRVICEGPYSVCRNPLYVGTFLMTLSIICQLMSLSLAAAFLLATVWYLATTVSYEERNLRRIFGDEFVAYQNRVPRFWPNFALYRTPVTLSVKVEGLAAEARRMLRWGALPLAGILLMQLRGQTWWPVWFNLP